MEPFNPDNPPFLDLERRTNTLSAPAVRSLAEPASTTEELVATGIVYLWHDHWREAHEIAQAHEGESNHDFLHGILHRREKDYANAAYWFRRAGDHACFPLIASRVTEKAGDDPLRHRLLQGGTWSPAAFVDVVGKRRSRADDDFLRAVQAIEMMTFHEWLKDKT